MIKNKNNNNNKKQPQLSKLMSNLDKMLPSSTALFLCANLSLIKTQTLCKQKPSLQLLLQSSFSSLSVKEKPTKEIFLSL